MSDEYAPGEELAIETAEERETLLRTLEFMSPMLDKAMESTREAASWLLGSLLAVNGGALAAFLGSDKLPPEALYIAGPTWLVGIVLALGVGVLNVVMGQRGIQILGKYMADINTTLLSGTMIVPDWKGDTLRMQRWQKWPWLIGTASALCFVAGSIAAGTAMIDARVNPAPAPPATDTRSTAAAPGDRPPAVAHAR